MARAFAPVGRIEIIEKGLGRGQCLVERLDRLTPFRIPLHEILKLTVAESFARLTMMSNRSWTSSSSTPPPGRHKR